MLGVCGRVACSAAAGNGNRSSSRAHTPGTNLRSSGRMGNPSLSLELSLRVEGRQVLGACSGLGDEQAVEAAEQAVAEDEPVVAVGRPQPLGVRGLQRREVVIDDLAGLRWVG